MCAFKPLLFTFSTVCKCKCLHKGLLYNSAFLVLSFVMDYSSIVAVALAFHATTMHIKNWTGLATCSWDNENEIYSKTFNKLSYFISLDLF